MNHANIGLFVPHAGCPHQCSFCNQRSITGVKTRLSSADVVYAIEQSVNRRKIGSQVKFETAFFGGSFTAIPNDYMIELLESVQPYIDNETVCGIRISTRPDAIDENILKILKTYRVTSIELGAQSMHESVLLANKRGHSPHDVENASKLIKRYGFELGLQMMTGLYKSDYEKDISTAHRLIDLKPDTVRIYPTAVMKGTDLEFLYKCGEYIPMNFNRTVELCSELLLTFKKNNIKVIRLGLHDSQEMKDNMVAGIWHPAFREICEGHIMFEQIKKSLNNFSGLTGDIEIKVNPKDVSKLTGRGNAVKKKIESMGYKVFVVQDSNIEKDSIYCGRVD